MALDVLSAWNMTEQASAEFLNKLTDSIIGAGIAVHREYGAGLLESVYGPPLARALADRGLVIERQKRIKPLATGDKPASYRADLIVEKLVVVEIKAVERLLPVHAAQLRTYLRLAGCPVGLILNFNAAVLKDGIKRVVNNFPD